MNKAPSESRKEEAFQISQFLRLLGVAESDYSFTNHDPPDAIIIRNKRKISLEHTRLLVPEERSQESLRRICVSRAKKMFLSITQNSAVSAHILFDNLSGLTNELIETYASKICDGVINFSGPLHMLRSRHKSDDITLHLSLLPHPVHARWQCPNNSVGWVKKIRENALAERLSNKSTGLKKYRNEYDESWLLIFVDKTKGASMYTLSEPPAHATMFDKVFVSTDQEFIELGRATTARAPKGDD